MHKVKEKGKSKNNKSESESDSGEVRDSVDIGLPTHSGLGDEEPGKKPEQSVSGLKNIKTPIKRKSNDKHKKHKHTKKAKLQSSRRIRL